MRRPSKAENAGQIFRGVAALCALLGRPSAPQSGNEEREEDLAPLCAAINDAASKASVVWTTFVTFELYLSISIASITQRDLLFGIPVDLPLLNVKLPLAGFFLVAPALFVVFHFYLFLTFRLLVSPVNVLNRALMGMEADRCEAMRQRLDKFFLVQFLGGSEDSRNGFIGFSLRAIAWITTVAAPVIILLQCQARFLPFHAQSISIFHRIFLFIDLGIILYFWKETRRNDSAITGEGWTRVWGFAGFSTSIFFAVCSVFILTFPGERLYRLTLLDTFDAFGKEYSWIPNRIVINGDGAAGTQSDKAPLIRSLASRDLRFAVIKQSDLRNVDLSGASLDNATLASVDLRGAVYGCRNRQRDEPQCVIWTANACASFAYARIENSQMQGAVLNEAQMPFSILDGTSLQGASLSATNLDGASLNGAFLQGAFISHARLPGADLTRAGLQAADLDGSVLWGAELRDASFAGASARHADLQGVHFAHTDLSAASLSNAAAYKAYSYQYMSSNSKGLNGGVVEDNTDESDIDTLVDPRQTGAGLLINRQGKVADECLDDAERDAKTWLDTLLAEREPDKRMARAKSNLETLIASPDPSQPWPNGDRPKPDPKMEANFLGRLACKTGFAPYAARGLIANGQLSSMPREAGLALLKQLRVSSRTRTDTSADCDGAKGLDAADLIMLETIEEKMEAMAR